jgi:thiamine kinase-like enzyme
VAELMRGFHTASAMVQSAVPDARASNWSSEMSDPAAGPTVGGAIVCHNDVCLENVVFRAGRAVGFLDFDFAGPGRAVYDLSQMARMCVPVDDHESASRLGWLPADRPARLRVVADAYGLDASGRDTLVEMLADSMARGGEFVRRRVEAGDPNFIVMWNEMGGMERFDRRRSWWTAARTEFAAALH